MNLWIAITAFVGGTLLLLYCIEEFIENLSKTALTFGYSAFFLSVLLAGMDLENWAIGIPAVLGGVPEFGIGSAIGSALFLAGASLGLAGLVVPFEKQPPRDYLLLMFISPLILLLFISDFTVSQLEGVLLLVIFFGFLAYLYWTEKSENRGYIRDEEVHEALGEDESLNHSKWIYLLFTLLFLIGFSLGAEVAVLGAKGIVNELNLNGTIFGMTIVGIASSAEEITLTIEPIREGKHEIAIGNLIGSLVFFSTGNIGLLAMISPLSLESIVVHFYWPYLLSLTLLSGGFLLRGKIKKLEGVILISVYLSYWILSYTVL